MASRQQFIVGAVLVPIFLGILAILSKEVRCILKLETEASCQRDQGVEVEFIVKDEKALPIERAEIVITPSRGAPFTEYTDSNGYEKITLQPEEEVFYRLSKDGYKPFDGTINPRRLYNQKIERFLVPVSSGSLTPIDPVPDTPRPPTDEDNPSSAPTREKLIGTWYYAGSENGNRREICLHIKGNNSFDSTNFNSSYSGAEPEFYPGSWQFENGVLKLRTPPFTYADYQILSIEEDYFDSVLIDSSVANSPKVDRRFARQSCL